MSSETLIWARAWGLGCAGRRMTMFGFELEEVEAIIALGFVRRATKGPNTSSATAKEEN